MTAACEAFREVAPELALGVAEGEERAAALDHLAGCEDCRTELARLTETVDAVVQTAPSAEPPAGFEVRALASFDSISGAPERRRSGYRRVALAAAALLVALGLAAVVGAIVSRGDGGTEQVASRTEAVLRSPGGRPVGTVTVERPSNDSSGARSELVVSVDPGTPEGTYRVECDYDTGAPYRAGSVEVTADGVEGWRTAVSVPTYDLRRVRLVSTADGDNLEAEFPT